MAPDVAVTVRALIDEGATILAAAGIPSPRREALAIWADLWDGETGAGVLDADRSPGTRSEPFQQAVRRRAGGEPRAHVVGLVGFRHLVLLADRRALIPRPETEGLAELVLNVARTGRVVDIGTGTGCLALSLAAEGAFSEVVGTDISSSALNLARENRDRCSADVSLVQGDLCAPLRRGSFDALVSNPPYLTAEEYAELDPSVRDWEPREALIGGPDGLGPLTRILVEGREVVRAGGWLAMEIDCLRATECARRAGALGWTDVAIHSDLFGRERYLLARRSETS
jgi:release factor glutamine methyltransferase